MCELHALQRIKPFNQFNRHAVTNTGTNMTCIRTNNPTITEQLAQDGIYTKKLNHLSISKQVQTLWHIL